MQMVWRILNANFLTWCFAHLSRLSYAFLVIVHVVLLISLRPCLPLHIFYMYTFVSIIQKRTLSTNHLYLNLFWEIVHKKRAYPVLKIGWRCRNEIYLCILWTNANKMKKINKWSIQWTTINCIFYTFIDQCPPLYRLQTVSSSLCMN